MKKFIISDKRLITYTIIILSKIVVNMVKLLFQEDSYLKEFDTKITKVDNDKIFLYQTAFHPGPSGGLDTDTGLLYFPDIDFNSRVIRAFYEGGDIAHQLESTSQEIKEGMSVHGVIDWERRYRIMKLHTASHIIAALLYEKYNAKVTGGNISAEQARDDFDLSGVSNWKEVLEWSIKEANNIAKKCIEVKVYWLDREEAFKIPGIVKLADRFPPNIKKIRIVEIPSVDIQADGGPHIRNTCEIGEIVLLKLESKGSKRRRVYYTVRP